MMPWTIVLTCLLGTLGAPGGQDDQQRAVELAMSTLAGVLKIHTDEIRLVSVQAVDWPNPGLGCPEPGAIYPQVITPGFRIRLRVQDSEYSVHTGRGRAVVCSGGTPKEQPGRTPVRPALAASDTARRHLAAALEVPSDEIGIVRVRPWRAGDRRCDPPKETTVTGETFFVELTHGRKTYPYRATPDVAWACDRDFRRP